MKLERLESERSKRNWTQEDVANRLGVARSTYANWENGKREVDLDSVDKLADIFDVSVDFLMGRTNVRSRIISSSVAAEPEVQFIMRAKEEMSPKAYAKFLKLVEQAKKAFDEEDE